MTLKLSTLKFATATSLKNFRKRHKLRRQDLAVMLNLRTYTIVKNESNCSSSLNPTSRLMLRLIDAKIVTIEECMAYSINHTTEEKKASIERLHSMRKGKVGYDKKHWDDVYVMAGIIDL